MPVLCFFISALLHGVAHGGRNGATWGLAPSSAKAALPTLNPEAEVVQLRAKVASLQADKKKLALAARHTLEVVREAEKEEKERERVPPKSTLQYELQQARSKIVDLEKVDSTQITQISTVQSEKQALLASMQSLMSPNSTAQAEAQAQQSKAVDDAVEEVETRYARELSATQAKLAATQKERDGAKEAAGFVQAQDSRYKATIGELRGTNAELQKASRGMQLRFTDEFDFLKAQLREAEANTTAAVQQARQIGQLVEENDAASSKEDRKLESKANLEDERLKNATRTTQLLYIQNSQLAQDAEKVRAEEQRMQSEERASKTTLTHQLRLAESRAARAEAQNAEQAKATIAQNELEAKLTTAEERASNASNEVQLLEAENEHARAEVNNLNVETQDLKSAGEHSKSEFEQQINVAEAEMKREEADAKAEKTNQVVAPGMKLKLHNTEEEARKADKQVHLLQAQNEEYKAEVEKLTLANGDLNSTVMEDEKALAQKEKLNVYSAEVASHTTPAAVDHTIAADVAPIPRVADPIGELTRLGAELRGRLLSRNVST